MAEKLEVERKFDVGDADELPDLTSITGARSRVSVQTVSGHFG